MRRARTCWILGFAVGYLLAACDGTDYKRGLWGPGGGGFGAGACGTYASCDTCTPVEGCGWCTAPNGSGVCTPDPDDCPTEEFRWTWNPSGCRVAADASVLVSDVSSVQQSDSSPSVKDAAPSADVDVERATDVGAATR